MDEMEEGKRKHGRQKTSWLNTITMSDLSDLTDLLVHAFQNRKQRRSPALSKKKAAG